MIRPILYTGRLSLRPFMPADASAVYTLLSVPDIAQGTLNIPYPYPEGAAEDWIATHIQSYLEKGDITFALELRDANKLIGAMGIHPTVTHHRAEIGYWIGKPYWGNGYATEAGQRMIQYGFEVLGLNRIYASHFPQNPASGRVMQKIGMSYEGTHRQMYFKRDHYEDGVMYSILRSEWEHLS